MTDLSMERRIRELADDYNRPPATPRDEIWAGIEEGLAAALGGRAGGARRGLGARVGPSPAWFAWAAAAVLVLGIGIGRLTAPGPGAGGTPRSGPDAAAEPGGGGAGGVNGVLRAAALRHLDHSESLLSLVRADAGAGLVDPAVGRWGKGLLLETRLLLDASVASDPALRALLEDLELILAQVALLSGEEGQDALQGTQELRLIAQGMEESDVLTRIRTVLSASVNTTM